MPRMSPLEATTPHHAYDELVSSLGKEAVSKDPRLLDSYSNDYSIARPQPTALVALPRSTADAQGIARLP